MEAQENNERVCFEDLCETIRKFALSISINFVKSINMDKLSVKERAGRISLQKNLLIEEIQALDRPEYFLNRNHTDQLYELFKSAGHLNNAEELNKLQQAMILSEKYVRLQVMSLDVSVREKMESRKEKDKTYHDMFHGDKEAAALYQALGEVDECIHLVVVPSNIYDLTKMALCHDWSAPKEPIYVGCKTNELKCVIDCIKCFNPDFNYANIGRCGLFISKAGKPVTAHDLATSFCKKLKTKGIIEYTIAGCRKKY